MLPSPPQARRGGRILQSVTVGALPILNRILDRMRLAEFLHAALPPEDRRMKLSPVKGLLLLVRNVLVSREPIYGVGEWAARHAHDLLGLGPQETQLLNDDRVGRALDKLFAADVPALTLAVAAHVVREFGVRLDELHNDSTTISFYGAYSAAAEERRAFGRPTAAITFGHSKDHRPDLKQLLFILTVSKDGGVPLHFRVESGNVVDDQTHRDTWELLCQLTRLAAFRDKLRSPRSRYRQEAKVHEAVQEILETTETASWIRVQVQPLTVERYRQDRRGRPGQQTRYVKHVDMRFDLEYAIDDAQVADDAQCDGVFPLVTNVLDLSQLAVLQVYKRQPTIEKRFSQLKTDFEVAPVYLKSVHRIQSLLCVYFFALLVEALLERELRRAMQARGIEALPLYPEGRDCRWPTARRVIDLFETIQRHTWRRPNRPAELLVTELPRLHRRLLKLLGLKPDDYGR